MKPLLRGWLSLCLATSLLLAAVQPAPAQINNRPGGNNMGQPGGNNFGQPGGNNFGQPGGNNFGQPGGNNFGQPGGNNFGQPIQFGNPQANAAAAQTASSVGAGMIVAGIGMILAGLALTGGVVYMAMQGQKTSYGGSRRRKKPRRDDDD